MRLKLITFYLLIVSALALVGYISYTGLNNLMTTLHEAIQPDERTEQFQQILNYISEAENNIRMYTITQDKKYLEPYNQAFEELQDHIVWLYSEYEKDTVLINYLDRIFNLIQDKIYVQEDLIYLKRRNQRPDVFGEVLAEINTIETKINRPDTIMSIKRRPFIIDTLNSYRPPADDPSGNRKKGFFARLFGTKDKEDQFLEPPEEQVALESQVEREINDTITTIVDKPIEITKPIEETMNEIKRRDQYILKMVTESELRLTKKDDELSRQVEEAIDSVNSYIQVKSVQKAEEASTLYKQTTKYITIVGSAMAMIFLILIFIVMKDFQVILKTKKELEVAKNKAENLAKVKEEFLASMSHEIRTPLNAIIGFSKHISESVLSARDKKYFSIIRNSSQHLFEIINDILDFSKLDSGQMKIEKTPFNLSKLIEETSESFRSEVDVKGLKLHLKIDNHLIRREILGDPYRIRQILNNLIGNAIKFTSEGSITVEAALVNPEVLKLSVTDTGIGIPDEKIRMIFEKFAQADTSTTRKYGGTGLGLTIVKKLVRLMKGKITVKSKVNHGSSFQVTIPTALAKSSTVKAKDTMIEYHDLSGITCLIVDDDNYNLMLLEKSLKDYYVKVFSVTSGKEALDYAGQIAFDQIILDLQMPEMDGYETARKLRGRNFNNPIFALSAFVNDEVLKNCKQAGIDEVISKPFNEKELIRSIIHKHGIDKKMVTAGNIQKIQSKEPGENENADFKDRMLHIYIKNLDEFLGATDFERIENSYGTIKYAAHKLIPSSRHMGFEELVILLKRADEFKLNGQNASDASDLIHRIRKSVMKIRDDLTAQYSNVT